MTENAQDYLIEWLAAHGPDEWHRVARSWNWDAGYRVLNWIVDQSACDKGTALQLFWLGSPDYFLAYRNRDAVLAQVPYNVDNFDFLTRVLTHWRAGRYNTADFATEEITDMASAFAHVEAHQDPASLPWIVPPDAEGYPPALVKKFRDEGVSF